MNDPSSESLSDSPKGVSDRSTDQHDPIMRALGSSEDLYGIATWEPRTTLDRISAGLYALFDRHQRVIIVAITVIVLMFPTVSIFIFYPGYAVPLLVYTGLSIVPASLLVGFIWYTDGTLREPLVPLVVTFFLGAVLSGVASIVNGSFLLVEEPGLVAYFLLMYLIVAPGEEFVKMIGIRAYAYESDHFSAVIDGAVYGAAAGLGFATAENIVYIFEFAEVLGVEAIVTERALAGPGHVVYTAIVGYYLGLAKYNPANAGPVVVKGLLIATFLHATYNFGVLFIGWWILAVDVLGFVYLFWLLWRYRKTYRTAYQAEPAPLEPKGEFPEEKQLQLLLSLYQSGVFTDEEFKEKRQMIRDKN